MAERLEVGELDCRLSWQRCIKDDGDAAFEPTERGVCCRGCYVIMHLEKWSNRAGWALSTEGASV